MTSVNHGERLTVGAAYRQLRDAFRAAALPSADLDARLLIEHLLGLSALDLLRDPAAVIGGEAVGRLEEARRRRLAGEPVHRIIGWREFYGLRLRLSPEALEPRPDTEVLVDAVLPFLKARCDRRGSASILDLGTGTGAVALALITAEPRATALGSDISASVLETARDNAQLNGVGNSFAAQKSDWLSEIDGQFDLIVSNPPYIATETIALLDPAVSGYDPLAALDGGVDGLDAYRAIAAQVGGHLEPHGRIGLEIGFDQVDQVEEIFTVAGYNRIGLDRDLGGNPRVMTFERGVGLK